MKKYTNLIGYGSYGYIFYPPLEFNYELLNLDKNINYITKLTLKIDGNEEINNQILINKIDISNEYHLGCYYKSEIKPNIININDFKIFKSYDIYDLCLIIQKHGGKDLFYLFKNNKINNYQEYKLFLIEFYRILEGIKKFNENNLIHHDINPKNIVYDKSNNRLNYIDFNLTNNKDKIIYESNKSQYEYGIFHGSFPIESGFYNKKEYDKIKELPDTTIDTYCIELKKKLLFNTSIDKIKIIKALSDLFKYYYILDNDKINDNFKIKLINNFNTFLLNIKNINYNDFIEQSLNTFDLYGYGLCLLYSLKYCYVYLSTELTNELYELIYKIIDLNVFTRLTIEQTQTIFLNILIKHNIIINNK